MRILGIDPGLQRTGWGVIAFERNTLRFIAADVIRSDAKTPLDKRLCELHDGVQRVITLYQPQVAAVEETFVSVNGASTMKLGQARGAVMLSCAIAGLAVSEYAATLVKKSLVGVGRAEKDQVAMMVKHLLPGCQTMQADATDALAVAICHTSHARMRALS